MAFGNATKGYVKKHSGGGGGGGTSNYNDLSNKPQINGVTLSGNKTSEDLGISGGGGLTITELSGTTFNKNDYKAVIVAIQYTEYPSVNRTTLVYPTSIFDRSFNAIEDVTESKTIGISFTLSSNSVTVDKFWGDGDVYKIYGVN